MFLSRDKFERMENKIERMENAEKYHSSDLEKLNVKLDNFEAKKKIDMDKLTSQHYIEMNEVRSECKVKMNQIELDLERDHDKEVREFKDRAVKAEALVVGKEEVIKAKDDSIVKLKEQMEFLATKIPTIELDKLNFTVQTTNNNGSSK